MSESSRDRLGAVSGIGFAVLFTAGVMLPSLPGGGDSEAAITAFYADSGNRITVIVAMYLLVLAGIAFIGFVSDLHRRLRQAEGESGTLATIALVAGAVFVTMLGATSAAWGSVSAGIAFGSEAQPGSEIPVWFAQLGYATLLIPGMLSAIAVIIATSLATLRAHVFPVWLARTGFVCAVVLVFSVGFIPMIALPIWTMATSVAMLKSPVRHAEQAAQSVLKAA